jgi:hypothetical protein
VALDEKLFREETGFLARSSQIVRRKVFSSLHSRLAFAKNAPRFESFKKGGFP